MESVNERVARTALERDLRPTTVASYKRLLQRLPDFDNVYEFLLSIENPNTKRSTIIALRSVYGLDLRIPKALPRKYDLASDDTYRLALMLTPHTARGLLMLDAGLRLGEACAVTADSLTDRWLTVANQIQSKRLVPVKGTVGRIGVPATLVPVIQGLTETADPDCVRESLRRAGHKVGISLNPHQLRHAYLTKLVNSNVPLPVIQRQARHSDVQTTLRVYYQCNDAGVLGFLDGLQP